MVYCDGAVGPVSQEIYSAVTDIQYERAADEFHWLVEVRTPSLSHLHPFRRTVELACVVYHTFGDQRTSSPLVWTSHIDTLST